MAAHLASHFLYAVVLIALAENSHVLVELPDSFAADNKLALDAPDIAVAGLADIERNPAVHELHLNYLFPPDFFAGLSVPVFQVR
ncbi:hypothetical protein JCM21738_312 [Mesobacillus boroniphilus JCM 21738]|uniref:Uncharacterized protein n=1 Tax=Mesobacillus boroniphilus JCM 21738 TaxID=1294265 RepID=W4RGU3_9BACI|nr:hypothetical protein JCM21738_312 [Mesobacillus boroniphilus JCM 21738]